MKRFLSTLGLAALVGTAALAGVETNTASADRLGSKWVGKESGTWTFEWRRQRSTSNVFNAYWRHRTLPPIQGQIKIYISGTSVTITRPPMPNSPVSCTYKGTYRKRDVHNGIPARASGTVSCSNGATAPWRATIR